MASTKPPAHLYPLQVNPTTGEPFLRLPAPLDNIIITPPRLSDAAALTAALSDPRVYKTLKAPPFPYTLSHAEGWLSLITKASDASLQELKEAYDASSGGPLPFVGTCPVRYLREIVEDGSEVMIGDIDVHRCEFPGLVDEDERKRLAKANSELPVGSPDIAWCFGDFVAGTHHGRGIMTAAVKTLMQGWMIPRMGARKIRAETFIGNIGSTRVFEKNGYVLESIISGEVVTNCGEKYSGHNILWWRAPEI